MAKLDKNEIDGGRMMLNELEQAEVRRASEALAWVNDFALRVHTDRMPDMLLQAMGRVTREQAERYERVARAYRSRREVE